MLSPARSRAGRKAALQPPRPRSPRSIPAPCACRTRSFAEEMRKAGLEPRTRLADLATVEAPAEVAEHLRITAGDPVVRRTRHMFASDRPSRSHAHRLRRRRHARGDRDQRLPQPAMGFPTSGQPNKLGTDDSATTPLRERHRSRVPRGRTSPGDPAIRRWPMGAARRSPGDGRDTTRWSDP